MAVQETILKLPRELQLEDDDAQIPQGVKHIINLFLRSALPIAALQFLKYQFSLLVKIERMRCSTFHELSIFLIDSSDMPSVYSLAKDMGSEIYWNPMVRFMV